MNGGEGKKRPAQKGAGTKGAGRGEDLRQEARPDAGREEAGRGEDMLLDTDLVGYDGLAAGVILQACTDYRKARKKLKRRSDNRKADGMIRECERFFRSGWFEMLSETDGRRMLEQLRRETE